MQDLMNLYNRKSKEIKTRLNEFKNLSEEEQFREFQFCLLTPQSNAQRCWQAVEEISNLKEFIDIPSNSVTLQSGISNRHSRTKGSIINGNAYNENNIYNILKSKTRFHNTKTKRILNSKEQWKSIKRKLNDKNIKELRNFLADNVKGYGLKESGHFLRNIGLSNNKIVILDRHILRNLKAFNIIQEDKIKNKKHYLEIETAFLNFAEKINIPADELDLLFWSKENGEIFK